MRFLVYISFHDAEEKIIIEVPDGASEEEINQRVREAALEMVHLYFERIDDD